MEESISILADYVGMKLCWRWHIAFRIVLVLVVVRAVKVEDHRGHRSHSIGIVRRTEELISVLDWSQ